MLLPFVLAEICFFKKKEIAGLRKEAGFAGKGRLHGPVSTPIRSLPFAVLPPTFAPG